MTRLDLVLQKHPDHADGIQILASRDPSGNLKYLDWSVKVLVSKQALAPEIADVVDLFHRFSGQSYGRNRRRDRVRRDIYTYRPRDLASLRDNLLRIARASKRKLRERERLYRIEGAIEADIIYDSPDLIVRHIKNKQASVHYGHSTKWCISMLREGYFEDYTTNNATFFFFERKTPLSDQFDKVALMIPRNKEHSEFSEAFTATDHRVDMMSLAHVFGPRVFDIFREIHERSRQHPSSAMFRVYAGDATKEQLESVFSNIVKGGMRPHETETALGAICCNDAAPWSLLEEILQRATSLSRAAYRKWKTRGPRGGFEIAAKNLERATLSALAIHPNVPLEVREKLVKNLRRRHVNIATICRTANDAPIEISYHVGVTERVGARGRFRRRRRYRLRRVSVEQLLRLSARYARRAKTLQRKLNEKKKRDAARAKKRGSRK